MTFNDFSAQMNSFVKDLTGTKDMSDATRMALMRMSEAQKKVAYNYLTNSGAQLGENYNAFIGRLNSSYTINKQSIIDAATDYKTLSLAKLQGVLADERLYGGKGNIIVRTQEEITTILGEIEAYKELDGTQKAYVQNLFTQAFKQQQVVESNKKLGASFKTMFAANPVGTISMIITAAITLYQVIRQFIPTTEELIQKGEEAAQAMAGLRSEFENQQKVVDNIGDSYAKLSQGVDQLTGKNISLSNEDYEEYLNLSNQLADVFPDLVSYIDEQGNKILDLSGDYEEINTQLEEYIELQRKALAESATEKLPDMIKGANAGVKTIRKENESLEAELFLYKDAIDNLGVDGRFYDASIYSAQMQELLRTIGVEYFHDVEDPSYYIYDPEEAKRKIDAYFVEVESNIRKNTEKLANEYAAVNEELITAISADDAYQELPDQMQAVIQKIIRSTNWDKIGKTELADMMAYINSYMEHATEFEGDLELAFGLKTELNNNEVTVAEYQNKIREIIQLLREAGVGEEFITTLTAALDIESMPNVRDQANQLVSGFGFSHNQSYGWLSEMNSSTYQKYLKWRQTEDHALAESASSLDEYQAHFEKWCEGQVSALDAIDFEKLSTAKDKISALNDAYEKMKTDGRVSYDALESIGEQFSSLDNIDEYISRIAELSNDSEGLTKVLNEMALAAVNNAYSTEQLAQADEMVVAAMLKEAGISNALSAAQNLIAVAKGKVIAESKDATAASEASINALIDEISANEDAAGAIFALELQKYAVNSASIKTSADIANLMALAQAANATAQQLSVLAKAKSLMAKAEEIELNVELFSTDAGKRSAAWHRERAQALLNETISIYEDFSNFEWGDAAGGGGGGGSSFADTLKEEFDDLMEVYEHEIFLLEKNGGDTSAIISWYEKMQEKAHLLADTYRKLAEETGEDYSSYIRELQQNWWEYQEAIYDLQRDSLDTIVELTQDLVKWENEKQIEGLEDQVDLYDEIIERKIELIELAKKEREHNDSLADKLEEIAKLQSRIDLLALDDSREAKAQKAQLEEELNSLQKELSDEQYEYAAESQTDALEKELEAFEDEKDKEIEVLKDNLQSAEQLYQAAINRINNGWESLYGDLYAYNSKYGNMLNSELTSAWNTALAAAQKYGSFVGALNATGSDFGNGNKISIDSKASAWISEMKANSAAWFTAGANQGKLADRNNELAAQLSAYLGQSITRDSDGVWWIGNKRLYDLEIHHDGGVAGNQPTLKQDEVLSILKRGEPVLDKQSEIGLYKLIDFAQLIQERLLKPIDYSWVSKSVEGVTGALSNSYYSEHINNSPLDFHPTVHVQVNAHGEMSDSEARRIGESVADAAMNKFKDAFSRRGVTTLGNAALKA